MLRLQSFSVRRSRRLAVEIESLELSEGSIVLTGANGSGKSTLVLAVAGLLAWRGRAELQGMSVSARRAQARIGYLPQQPGGLEHLTVEQALTYAASLTGEPARGVSALVEGLDLGSLSRRRIGGLSGGERQRAYFAQAVVHRPPLVLLDEPTVGIDAEHRTVIRTFIRQLAASCCVLTVSHLPDDIRLLGDRTIVMRKGRPVFDDTSTVLEERGVVVGSGASAPRVPLDEALAAFEETQ